MLQSDFEPVPARVTRVFRLDQSRDFGRLRCFQEVLADLVPIPEKPFSGNPRKWIRIELNLTARAICWGFAEGETIFTTE